MAQQSLTSFHVHVLAPSVQKDDENLDYYYDFTQSIGEYTKAFKTLNMCWTWQPVTLQNFKKKIDAIVFSANTNNQQTVIFNLCDGDEINGAPGISVIRYLKENNIIFTGADTFYYDITTSKIPMKNAFNQQGVATANWEEINSATQNITGIFERIGKPIIVKPAVSGGSMGLGIKNVVYDEASLTTLIQQMFQGYRGWNLSFGGLVAEQFIAGPEYTVFMIGNYLEKQNAFIYPPVETLFHSALPEHEKFLSFDRLWETYEEEKPIGDNEDFYNYFPVEKQLALQIETLGWEAYKAVGGVGYGRVDLRMNKETGKLFVLEVNAQCGLSDDDNYTSVGAILRHSGNSFSEMIARIIKNGLERC